MGDAIGELVVAEVATWREGAADLWGLTRKLVRRSAIALLFGDDQQRGFALGDMVEAHFAMNAKPAVTLCPVALPGAPYSRLLRNADAIERCVLDIASARRGKKEAGDIVSILVNSPDEHGAPPSDGRIAGHLPVLFAAAYETCQTALTWTLFLLAQHPQAARALAAEISTASSPARTPTLARVAELPLLNAVIRESMRLLPPVPYQIRTALLPSRLGTAEIKPGNRVVLSAFLTNRMPERYDQADRFKPERWFSINPSPFEYLSFSAGPRMCPGSWFGSSIVKVALAAVNDALPPLGGARDQDRLPDRHHHGATRRIGGHASSSGWTMVAGADQRPGCRAGRFRGGSLRVENSPPCARAAGSIDGAVRPNCPAPSEYQGRTVARDSERRLTRPCKSVDW